jgi:hypothetical protein
MPTEFFKWLEISTDRGQGHAACGSKMPSATEETPTSTRQDIWAEPRYGTVPSKAQKLTGEIPDSNDTNKGNEKIHTFRPAGLKNSRIFS